MKNHKNINTILILIIVCLSVVATCYGIFSNQIIHIEKDFISVHGETIRLYGKGIYANDSVSMASQARAQDIVTLFFAIPLLLYSLKRKHQGSLKGQLLMTGTLGYFLYTYTTYAFTSNYNNFFLVYVMIMGLSFFAFILNINTKEMKQLKCHFSEKFPNKYLGIFLLLFGILMSLMWLGRIIPAFKIGIPVGLEHYTSLVIQALDFAIIIPTAILSGILLIKKKELGYLLAPIIIIKSVTLILSIDAMMISMTSAMVVVPIIEIIIFSILTLVFIANLWLIMRNMKEEII